MSKPTGSEFDGGPEPTRWQFADCVEAEDAGGLVYLWPSHGAPAIAPTRVFHDQPEAARFAKYLQSRLPRGIAASADGPLERGCDGRPATMRIAMVGAGYVGLVSGTCLADFGHDVVCVDKDEAKIAALNAGQSPIYEPGLSELVAANARAGRLFFTSDIREGMRGAQAVFICVGTPTLPGEGGADMRYVYQAAREISEAIEELRRRRQQVDFADRRLRRHRGDRRRARAARQFRRGLQSGVPARRRGDRRFQDSPTGW